MPAALLVKMLYKSVAPVKPYQLKLLDIACIIVSDTELVFMLSDARHLFIWLNTYCLSIITLNNSGVSIYLIILDKNISIADLRLGNVVLMPSKAQ